MKGSAMITFVAGALALISVAGGATGPVLWKQVAAGMTVEQLRVLYPETPKLVSYKNGRVVIKGAVTIPSCGTADVEIFHGATGVERVRASKSDLGVFRYACSAKVYQLMVQQYGPPSTEVPQSSGDDSIVTTWLKGPVTVIMDRTEGLNEEWTVTYAPTNAESGL